MKIIRTCAAILLALFLASCASVPKITSEQKIAVVSYSLDKSIVKEGAQPFYPGKALIDLNKGEDPYRWHKEALAVCWTDFKAAAPGIFGPGRLVDFAAIEGNTAILSATYVEPKLIMGQDTSPQSVKVFPAGLNYANILLPKTIQSVSAIVPADLYLSVDLRAEYFMWTGLSIGSVGGGVGKVRLYATLSLVSSSGKVLRQYQASGVSKDTAAMLLDSLDSEAYPRLIAQAQQDLFPRLAKEVAAW